MPSFNIDISQIAWFFSFLAAIMSVAAISGFQVWERLNEIESGAYNTDGDLLISSVKPYENIKVDQTNPAFEILGRLLSSSNDSLVASTSSEQESLGRSIAGGDEDVNAEITITTIDGRTAKAGIQMRWWKFNTYQLHGIAICGLLASLSSMMATLNAVFNIKSRGFLCMQQVWLCFAFVFSFSCMCLVTANEDSMGSICPYKSYRVMGWLGMVCSLLALVCYCTIDPICCCKPRAPPQQEKPISVTDCYEPCDVYEPCDPCEDNNTTHYTTHDTCC